MRSYVKDLGWFILLPVACASPGATLFNPARVCQPGNRVEVVWPTRSYPATITGNEDADGVCTVSYHSPVRRWSARIHSSRVYNRKGVRTECQMGSEVLVDWDGVQWHSAIVRAELDPESKCPIRYLELDDAWNEAVALDRIRRPDGVE